MRLAKPQARKFGRNCNSPSTRIQRSVSISALSASSMRPMALRMADQIMSAQKRASALQAPSLLRAPEAY